MQEEQKKKFLRSGICRWPFSVAVILSELIGAALLIYGDGSYDGWGAAIAVLVLWGPAACIAGGVCALINYFRDKLDRERWGREIAAFAGIFILAFLILLLTLLELLRCPPVSRLHTISCSSNLKQIGLSLAWYAGDYEGFLPPEDGAAGLECLRSTGVLTDYAVYICPGSGTKPAKSGPLTEDNCDYIYYGGGRLDNTEFVVATDKPGNHSRGVNILYSSGRVDIK